MTDSSIIFDVPEEYQNKYVFVKNILIPFSAKQTVKLNSLKADLGTADSEIYTNYRNKLATQIVADDFNSEKNEDGKYGTVSELFALDTQGNVVVNADAQSEALKKYFNSDGSVTAMEKDGATLSLGDTIKELMAQFNTDTAQHSSLYSYVVRVGETPSSYTHRWVDEFVDATNAAVDAAKAAGKNDPTGYYGIGVSDYGVHIVYVEGYVKEDTFDFADNYLDTHSSLYRLFKSYFEEQSSKLLSKDLESLKDEYVKAGTIKTSSVFNKFLKENKIDYDLLSKLAEDND